MTISTLENTDVRLAGIPSPPPTRNLIESLLDVAENVSDIFLSPMCVPEVRANGCIIKANTTSLPMLIPDDTRRIATDLISNRPNVLLRLEAEGSCDFSCYLGKSKRFRVNILSQRGSYAISLRVISNPDLPTFESLHLPVQLVRLMQMRSGLVIVSGPSGSGKSSTVAAILHRINEEKITHIVTVEDPLEYQFRHGQATILQRELYRDVPSFPLAIRAALRHPPHLIFLSTIPDRETMDMALEAADCGHLVMATLHTPDVSRTIEHVLRFFSPAEERATRARLARSLRAIASQRLVSRENGAGQFPIFEILFSTPRTRECITNGETGVISLAEAMREGKSEGMQCFEDELRKLHQTYNMSNDVIWEELFGDRVPPPPSSAAKDKAADVWPTYLTEPSLQRA